MEKECNFENPFRPGAGHKPPFLAGREAENEEFQRLLTQNTILENMVLTGLRGVGKTVLLDSLKPIAIQNGWLWAGTDLSESASISEVNIALRLLTDLSVVTSSIILKSKRTPTGFSSDTFNEKSLNFNALMKIFNETPGLISDKLKSVLEFVWQCLSAQKAQGLIFAYDEAQNLADQAEKGEYPLSLLLDVFQSLQKKDIRFMLVLTGLPTLFPKLVEARTFAERMFRVVFLDRLDENDCREAILKPIEASECPMKLKKQSVATIIRLSGGYPYFIQFICKEVYDAFIQKIDSGKEALVPVDEIVRKLDTDFFAGRWSRATDRQRELLSLIAKLKNSDMEFSVQEIVDMSKTEEGKPFSSSHVNQMLVSLSNAGLVYKNRYGKYSFAVPLLGHFILRQVSNQTP
ncbi:MAG: ATP-binding protein [Thermoleophilia bacterium]